MNSTEDGFTGDEANCINANRSSTFACASYNEDTRNTFLATLAERERALAESWSIFSVLQFFIYLFWAALIYVFIFIFWTAAIQHNIFCEIFVWQQKRYSRY